MRRARPYRGENPEPARMFMESLTSGPELENSLGHKGTFRLSEMPISPLALRLITAALLELCEDLF